MTRIMSSLLLFLTLFFTMNLVTRAQTQSASITIEHVFNVTTIFETELEPFVQDQPPEIDSFFVLADLAIRPNVEIVPQVLNIFPFILPTLKSHRTMIYSASDLPPPVQV